MTPNDEVAGLSTAIGLAAGFGGTDQKWLARLRDLNQRLTIALDNADHYYEEDGEGIEEEIGVGNWEPALE